MLLALLLAAAAPDAHQASTFDIERAMHGVVLLICDLGDGVAEFGSGIVVDDQGDVLTNLHVVSSAKEVRALAFDPRRTSYASMDGGLARIVFEREKELIRAHVVSGDPLLDLAVVRLEKPPPSLVVLPIAAAEAKIGDPVAALGHPEQNFWTVTRGQVSALHEGLIQHDAAVNKGNSGGPLVNDRGEVVGVNTKFLKGAQGIFYARPIALASKLIDVVKSPVVLDRSTPEAAVVSCEHAFEIGDPAFTQCIDWDRSAAVFKLALAQLADAKDAELTAVANELEVHELAHYGDVSRAVIARGARPHARDVLRAVAASPGFANDFPAHFRPLALAFILDDDAAEVGRAFDRFHDWLMDEATRAGKSAPKKPAASRTKSQAAIIAELEPILPAEAGLRDASAAVGLHVSLVDLAAVRRTMKMGLRVDDVQGVCPDHVWVSLTGRNLDGSLWHSSQFLEKHVDGWREMPFLDDDQLARCPHPATFPPPLSLAGMSLDGAREVTIAGLIAFLLLDPANGVAADLDEEHRWPATLEIIRKRAKPAAAVNADPQH